MLAYGDVHIAKVGDVACGEIDDHRFEGFHEVLDNYVHEVIVWGRAVHRHITVSGGYAT